VGYQALHLTTQGQYNTAVGGHALDAVTTANYNTATGMNAATGITTGCCNVAIGAGAFKGATTSSCNVIVGVCAGEGITSSGKNTLVGYDTAKAGNIGNKTVIGFCNSVSNDGNDEIVIGREIGGLGGQSFTFGKPSNRVYNIFTSNASWTRTSDLRLKKNIENSNLGLDFINNLRPVTYNWKASQDVDPSLTQHYNADTNHMDTEVKMNGLIAQEVKQALLDSGISETDVKDYGVWEEDKQGVQQISREMFVIPLINAIKELTKRIKDLEDK